MSDDLSSSSVSPSAGSSSEKDRVRELEAEVQLLNKTVTAALFIILLIAASLVFALRKQMLSVREDLVMMRPNVLQAFEQYEKNEKPQVKAFLGNLHTYSKTHPDFAPVFNKYIQLPVVAALMQEAAPAAAPANPAAPTLK